MSKTKSLEIDSLKLDLKNYRTVPQKNEIAAISAMIAIKPTRFFAVIESLIEYGYLPTENLIILDDNGFIVKEGNRRTAALKIIHGIYDKDKFSIPDNIKKKISLIDEVWKKANNKIPCTIYKISEIEKVNRIVNLTHAKGEKASRDVWGSVARARHNRNEKKGSEPTLDLLEKYLKKGGNLTSQQKERWSGDYHLTVLDEALRKIHERLGFDTIADLAKKYPKIVHKDELEEILRDVGLEIFGFKEIRDKHNDFAELYNIPVLNPVTPPSPKNPNTSPSPGTSTTPVPPASPSGKPASKPKAAGSPKGNSYAIGDPKQVTATLKKFNPKGANRQKVITLKQELLKIKLKDNPLAFCFLLRSIFEISAKVYSKENKLSTNKSNGREKTLVDLLRGATNHLTGNKSNKAMVKVLHGALSEIARPEGLLSVTSMNQLVHNPNFLVSPTDIAILFGNIYPLLEALN